MRLTRMAWFGGFSMGSGLRLVVLRQKFLMILVIMLLASCQTDKVVNINDLDPYKGCQVRSDGELVCPREDKNEKD